MRNAFFLIILSLVLAAANAAEQQMTPVLQYTPPSNAYRSAVGPSEDYSFNGFNASVQVYPFRPFSGDIQQIFRTTLLGDWIDPQHKEENVAGPPTFQTITIPGAQAVLTASFFENIVGVPRPHMRMVIVAGGEAAIVDASAGTVQSWQLALPALNAMGATLRVEAARAPPPLSQAAGHAIAGLYKGVKPKYTATMQNVTGYSHFTNALHYYLFSTDGRVYRAYDQLEVPAGGIARFDFAAAKRYDPENSGRYTVDGGKLIIQMEGGSPETIVTAIPQGGRVTINAVIYERQ